MTRIEPDPTQPMQPDKSLGDLFGDLTQEFSELVRAQTELAKTEIRTQADKAKQAAGAFGGAAVAAYMVYAAIAGFMFLRGRERAREFSIVPEETVESVKEDVKWAQQKIN